MKKQQNNDLTIKEDVQNLLGTVYISCVKQFEKNKYLDLSQNEYQTNTSFFYHNKINDLIRFNNNLVNDKSIVNNKLIRNELKKISKLLLQISTSTKKIEKRIFEVQELFDNIYKILIKKGYQWKM